MADASAQVKPVDVSALSPRALRRIGILAGFLKARNYRFSGDKQARCQQVLAAADKQKDREELKALVDWAEEYDRAGKRFNQARGLPPLLPRAA
ncbi:hypothetical protein M3795_25410 [Ralstonia pickettii]|jgi:hypothetical protein|uniref:hypothetical protein n=1 Tax=Ralstonia TaxID=48736 RepID=UPI00203E7196|nr:hypothetical protein [Ralstonia pickettii]MCM3583813.1 hypothetical protein [Ralstonia pickettii]